MKFVSTKPIPKKIIGPEVLEPSATTYPILDKLEQKGASRNSLAKKYSCPALIMPHP